MILKAEKIMRALIILCCLNHLSISIADNLLPSILGKLSGNLYDVMLMHSDHDTNEQDIWLSRQLPLSRTTWQLNAMNLIRRTAQNAIFGRRTIAVLIHYKQLFRRLAELKYVGYEYTLYLHLLILAREEDAKKAAFQNVKSIGRLTVLLMNRHSVVGLLSCERKLGYTLPLVCAEVNFTTFALALRGSNYQDHLKVACFVYTLVLLGRESPSQFSINTCSYPRVHYLLPMLMIKNISYTSYFFGDFNNMFRALVNGRIDLVSAPTTVSSDALARYSYPDVEAAYRIVYARKSDSHSLSLISVIVYSWRIVGATIISLLLVASFLVSGGRGTFSFNGAVDEVTYLLAAFLSTAVTIPEKRRRRFFRRMMCAAWLLGILPLSVYFRGELSSRVTVKSPANSLDTAEELEAELRAQKIAPCLVDYQGLKHIFEMPPAEGSVIMRYLRAAYHREKSKGLVVSSLEECLACARNIDRVCFALRMHHTYSLGGPPGIVQFKEPLNLHLWGIAARKFMPHLNVLRRTWQAIRESGALAAFELGQREGRENLSEGTDLELWGFFAQYAVLLAATTLVLIGEVLIHCCNVSDEFWFLRRRP